jgi:hypothetical protein
VRHQHGLEYLVFAKDLGALGRFEVEGLELRGDLLLSLGISGGRARRTLDESWGVWFAPRPTRAGRLLIIATLLFVPVIYLYVWCRLTPRWYDGKLRPRFGILVTAGAADALEGERVK